MQQIRAGLMGLWWRLVRFGFRLLYNELAWTYDMVAWGVSLGQWRKWQKTALKHLPPPPTLILELAHGTGNLQLDLHAAGYQRVGLDLSRAMGIIARRKLRRNHIAAPLVRGKGQALPFPDRTFDAVVSTFPTPFIFEAATLNEIARVLNADGRLIIVINGLLTGKNVVSQTLEFAYRITGQRGDPSNSTAETVLKAVFLEAGFGVELVTEPCPRSVAQLIIGTKTVDSRP